MGNKRISETMRRRYFSTFAAAARELGLVGAAAEGYRKSILRELGGVESSSNLTLEGYDLVMAQMASDAKDYARALHYLQNRARRLGYTCEVLAKQLLEQGFAENTGLTKSSGFCQYPLWHFKEDFLREIGGEVYEQYANCFQSYMHTGPFGGPEPVEEPMSQMGGMKMK